MLRRLRRQLRVYWLFSRASFEADFWLAAIAIGFVVLDVFCGAAFAIGMKVLTDGVQSQDVARVAPALVLIGLSGVGAAASWSIGYRVTLLLRERVLLLLDERLAALTARIPTLEHFERPDYLQEMELLAEQHSLLADVGRALIFNVGIVLQVVISIILLASVQPRLLLMVVFAAPALWLGYVAQRGIVLVNQQVRQPRRLETLLRELATHAEAAKEVRLFGLQADLLERHRQVRAEVDRMEDRVGLQNALLTSIGWLVFGCGFIGALLVLDGPTAALDAQTEHALFERYAGAARRIAATNGAITLLVSHRFSSVRMADLIIVLADGRVVEQGSHAELMAARGTYAELYQLQARAYQ